MIQSIASELYIRKNYRTFLSNWTFSCHAFLQRGVYEYWVSWKYLARISGQTFSTLTTRSATNASSVACFSPTKNLSKTMLPDLFRIKRPCLTWRLSKNKVPIKKLWCSVYLPASCAIAGVIKTDTMFARATEVSKETVNNIPYSRYPSMIRAFLHLNYRK